MALGRDVPLGSLSRPVLFQHPLIPIRARMPVSVAPVFRCEKVIEIELLSAAMEVSHRSRQYERIELVGVRS
jgi:hypothetical protein